MGGGAAAGGRGHTLTLAVLTFAGVAFALQQTMIIPALPALQRELDTSTTWVTWLLTAFLLTASVATPILGKLGDQYGKERLLVIALGVFLLGSLAAIFAPSIWVLIACRAVQGTGAAVFPLSFAIIKDEFPPERIGSAVGVVSAVFGVGGGLGLVLSGVIVDHLSWRWLFGVGGAGVAVAVVLVHLFVPESPVKTRSRVDVPGALLLSGGLVCLLLALTEGERWGWSSPAVVALLAAAVCLLLGWAAVELRVAEPMVDMRMLAHRPVLVANLTGLVSGFAMFGSFVLVPNFVETPGELPAGIARLVDYGFGASTTQAGLLLAPGAIAGFFTGPLAGPLGRRLGARAPLSLGLVLGAAGIALLAGLHAEPWQVALGMLVLGAGLPLTFAAMATVIVQTVDRRETGVATGMNTVMRTVGGVVGAQVGAAILAANTIAGTSVPSESAFAAAFWMSAAAALAAAVLAFAALPRRRGGPRALARPAEALE